MSTAPRPRSSPAELAKDVLSRLDNARAQLERARAVAGRGDLAATDARLAELEAELGRAIDEVQVAVRQDVRRLLSAGSSSADA